MVRLIEDKLLTEITRREKLSPRIRTIVKLLRVRIIIFFFFASFNMENYSKLLSSRPRLKHPFSTHMFEKKYLPTQHWLIYNFSLVCDT